LYKLGILYASHGASLVLDKDEDNLRLYRPIKAGIG